MMTVNSNPSEDSISYILERISGDARFTALIKELQAAIDCFQEDEKNTSLRENIIFRQFADKILTDHERAIYYGLPKGCRMRENTKIISPEKLKCGEHVWIGEGAVLDASGGLEIGDHTSIGLSVFIWTHTSYKANLEMSNYPNSDLIERLPTKIGKGVFIAGPSVISHGVTLGDRTVVMPMSFVAKSFDGDCVIGGNPARIIRMLE
jgi:acetyltransferase-like isoleucine patch superfamily enzyme